MVEALVSFALEQSASILDPEIRQTVRLVVGVRKEVEKLSTTLDSIQRVLNDAEKKQMKDKPVRDWLEKLKDVTYDAEDLLDEWNTAILKSQIERATNAPTFKKVCSCFLSPNLFCLSRVFLRCTIGSKIKDIKEKLDEIATEKDKFNFILSGGDGVEEPVRVERLETTSEIDVPKVRGRVKDKHTILSKLLCESSSEEERGLHVISIVGMGGIGKTTLAKFVFNDDEVLAHFDKRIWVCVSEPFEQMRIGRAIVEDLEGSAPNFLRLEAMQKHLKNSIAGKKFLLVLDDVWIEEYQMWEPLKLSLEYGAKGSRILVTTRNEGVANMMETTYVHYLVILSEEECWLLFSQIAFLGKGREECEKLEEVGRKIAKKCKGLPLAAKTLGSLLRRKSTKQDWENVLNSETWEIEDVETGLFAPLLLSYYDLPSPLKRCFSYCSIFPKDYRIWKDDLIKLWMSQGFLSSKGTIDMETKGGEYFDNLVMRSFFQDFVKDEDGGSIIGCKMHDIAHDFAQFLAKNECFIMEIDKWELRRESSCIKARHATIALATTTSELPPACYDVKNLRTLQIHKYSNPFVSFDRFTCLRALNIRHIDKLPSMIGKLVHLRYLNFSWNCVLEELPETVCDLYNLQTLNVNHCSRLRKLPQGMSKLINLRHLEIEGTESLITMPHGIGRMSSLRTLSKLIISDDNNEEGCKLGELKNLQHLKGHLQVTGLENVTNVEDAIETKLIEKHLRGLELQSSYRVKEVMGNVIEALRPHPELEYLMIRRYGGTMFPNWMTSLSNLRNLILDRCYNCDCLPPNLGKLPSLEELHIECMQNLKRVGLEFLDIGINNDEDRTSKKDGTAPLIVFPKLKLLSFTNLDEWEEWVAPTRKRQEDEEDDSIIIMPSLLFLDIRGCSKLKALPQYLQKIPLRQLTIRGCAILSQSCRTGVGEDPSVIISELILPQ